MVQGGGSEGGAQSEYPKLHFSFRGHGHGGFMGTDRDRERAREHAYNLFVPLVYNNIVGYMPTMCSEVN